MLVKDEAKTLPRTLPSMLPAIDTWTVMDTGSTDHTAEIAAEILGRWNGEIIERPFDGFGPSRTALLQAARDKADYTLMLDADMTIEVNADRPRFDADAYQLKIHGGNIAWRLPLLTRSQHPFEYRGVAHAFLASDHAARIAPSDWIDIHHAGPWATREKLERDLALLQAEFLAHPNDARTVFYLAETHRFLGHVDEAIRFYLMRTSMGGFEEERWYARYQAGCLLGAHVEGLQGAEQLVKAWRERPGRAEALRALARLADSVADKLEQPADLLFVEPNAYRKAAA